MRYRVINVANGTSELFDNREEATAAFDKLFIPRYKALVKKLGHVPDDKERLALERAITKRIVAFSFDFTDDVDEDGNLTPEAERRYAEILNDYLDEDDENNESNESNASYGTDAR